MSVKPEHHPGWRDPDSQIELSPQRLMCAAHGEHFRAKWPTGFLVSGLAVFKAAVEGTALLEACGWREGETVPVAKINEVTSTRPLCYFVAREVLREVLVENVLGLEKHRCDVCRFTRAAGPYNTRVSVVETKTLMLCVECALDAGERLHREYPNGHPTLFTS